MEGTLHPLEDLLNPQRGAEETDAQNTSTKAGPERDLSHWLRAAMVS